MSAPEREAVLAAENAALRARVAELEGLLYAADGWSAPLEWGLTAAEARMMGVLVSRPLATRAAFLAAMYGDVGKDEPAPRIVDVFVCKIRRKLRPFGVAIVTVWGEGWRLPPAQREALRRGAVSIPAEGV